MWLAIGENRIIVGRIVSEIRHSKVRMVSLPVTRQGSERDARCGARFIHLGPVGEVSILSESE